MFCLRSNEIEQLLCLASDFPNDEDFIIFPTSGSGGHYRL